MTRGEGIMIYSTKTGRSMARCTIEFNGDMYPSGHGYDFIERLQHSTPETLEKNMHRFNDDYFEYDDPKMTYTKKCRIDLLDDGFMADYQYVYNCTDKTIRLKAPWKTDKYYDIPPHEVYGFYFGELELIKKAI